MRCSLEEIQFIALLLSFSFNGLDINLGIDSMSILFFSQKKTIESMYFMSLFSFGNLFNLFRKRPTIVELTSR